MTSYVPVVKNGASGAIFYIGLIDQANTKLLKANPTLASGDFKVSIDGGAFANLGTLPTVTPAAGRSVKVTLSQAEVNGDNITVVGVDAAGAEWCDAFVNIQTVARQIDDLAFPNTSGRGIDVATTGEVGLDFNNILSSTTATLNALTITNAMTVTGATVHTGNVSFADGITVAAPSTSNRAGVTITGNGTGAGLISTGGSTGDGVRAVGGASGHGLSAAGTGTTKHGINATGGATTSAGIAAAGGATSGDGILVSATSGHGINTAGAGTTKHGILATGGATSSDGINAAGGGTGNGLNLTGGATGHGLKTLGGATSGDGANIAGQTSGHGLTVTGVGTTRHGLNATGGATTSAGISATGGATSGDGVLITATTSGHGITATGVGTTKHGMNLAGGATTSNGLNATGGGVGHGILATSGNGATGDGIRGFAASTAGNGMNLLGTTTGNGLLSTGGASAGGDGADFVAGGGVDIRGNLTGNITGSLSGSVGSVTARVTANVDQIDGAAWSTHTTGMAPGDLRNIKGTASAGAAGYAGIDWSAINAPTTVVNLSGTTIKAITDPISATANVTQWNGASVAAPNVAGVPIVDVTYIKGTISPAAAGSVRADAVTGNVGGNVTGSIGSLAAQAKADVNAEVVDALSVDTYAEPGQGAPAATASLATKIGYTYKAWRNKATQTDSQYSLYGDDTVTIDQKRTVDDDGLTFTSDEVASGP